MTKKAADKWAYDLDKDPIDQGEIWDADVINQSIEMILATNFGERLFIPSFGFGLYSRIFENLNSRNAESLLNEIANSLKKWEDRIIVHEGGMRIIADVDRHKFVLIIPYTIKRMNIQSEFKKQIFSNS